LQIKSSAYLERDVEAVQEVHVAAPFVEREPPIVRRAADQDLHVLQLEDVPRKSEMLACS